MDRIIQSYMDSFLKSQQIEEKINVNNLRCLLHIVLLSKFILIIMIWGI